MRTLKPPQQRPVVNTKPRSRASTTKHGALYRLHRWKRESRAFRDTPEGALCWLCKARGLIVPSECVDHDPPHNGCEQAFWDRSTWRALCLPCHASVTLAQRAGRPVRVRGCTVDGMPLDPSHFWHRNSDA
jgi:5-methylcytosine-specific restriction protein A